MLHRVDFVLRDWRCPALVLSAVLALLLTAHAFEHFAGLGPCPLCLRQREIYWVAAAIAVFSLIVWVISKNRRFMLVLNIMLGFVFLAGAVIAAYHTGVEWGLWPAPAGCTANPTIDIGAIDLSDLNRPQSVIACTTAAWHMLGLSMAGWNTLIALGLSAISFRAVQAAWPDVMVSEPGAGPGDEGKA